MDQGSLAMGICREYGGKLNMWSYDKRLQYPVKIKQTNPQLAKIIITQYGGPDGELSASMRYLSQRYSMPYSEVKGTLTDIGTEELAHFEMIGAMVHQLTKDLTEEEIKKGGFADYFVDHTLGLYPMAASGTPFTSKYFAVKGDTIADLTEDMAAEQKARAVYDNILRFADDPDVRDPIKFLRQREIVHFQRFGEALRVVQDHLDSKNFYAFNPSFDKPGR
jgi:spore coat protein JC